MAAYIGCKIKIEADDGTYTGILRAIDKNNGRLTIDQVTCKESGKQLAGILHFYSKQIYDVSVLEEKKKVRGAVSDDTTTKGRNILAGKMNPPHLKKLKNIERDRLLLAKHAPRGRTAVTSTPEREIQQTSSLTNGAPDSPVTPSMGGGGVTPSGGGSDHHSTSSSDEGNVDSTKTLEHSMSSSPGQNDSGLSSSDNKLSLKYTVIDQLDETFTDAVEHLRSQKMVGLSAHGVDLGRNGQLYWLGISTRHHTILFDILTLGLEAFDEGLADILKSPRIQKVTHDCRRLSDMMHHKYNIQLVNVFDTQVAYASLYHMTNQYYPRYVDSLGTLLLQYKKEIDSSLIPSQGKVRESSKKSDQEVWGQRPIPEELLELATKYTMHLLPLRMVLLDRLLQRFTTGVDIYLDSLRAVTDESTLTAKMAMLHTLPADFAKLEGYRSPVKKDSSLFDENGFYENSISISDPHIKYSHDSVWHKGDGVPRVGGMDFCRRNRSRSRGRTGDRVRRSSSKVSDEEGGTSVIAHGRQHTDTPTESPVPSFIETLDLNSPERPELKQPEKVKKAPEVVLIASGHESRSCVPKLADRVPDLARNMVENGKDSGGEYDLIPAQDSDGIQRVPALQSRLPGKFVAPSIKFDPNINPQAESASGSSQDTQQPQSVINHTSEENVESHLKTIPNYTTGQTLQSRLPKCAQLNTSPDFSTTTARGVAKEVNSGGYLSLGRGYMMKRPDQSS